METWRPCRTIAAEGLALLALAEQRAQQYHIRGELLRGASCCDLSNVAQRSHLGGHGDLAPVQGDCSWRAGPAGAG